MLKGIPADTPVGRIRVAVAPETVEVAVTHDHNVGLSSSAGAVAC